MKVCQPSGMQSLTDTVGKAQCKEFPFIFIAINHNNMAIIGDTLITSQQSGIKNWTRALLLKQRL
jgi:hypothetical protein